MERKIALPLLATVTAGLLIASGCSSGSGDAPAPSPSSTAPTAATAAAPAPEPTATLAADASLPPGAQQGVFDLDDDGTADPTCGTQDFGAGLMLRIPCGDFSGYAHTPEDGTALVPDSLYRLPGPDTVDLSGISGENLQALDDTGREVFILIFNSDGLFETGSDVINSTDTMDATIRLVNARFPGGDIQLRGHTDATGSAGTNQPLSERRAATVARYLTDHGIRAASVTSVGLGSTRPLVLETNPDGSANPAGQAFNRRVELVVRLPRK